MIRKNQVRDYHRQNRKEQNRRTQYGKEQNSTEQNRTSGMRRQFELALISSRNIKELVILRALLTGVNPISVVRIYYENETLSVLIIMSPQWANFILRNIEVKE